jgi:PadR family transcriptional regulator, regulatory protein PadR
VRRRALWHPHAGGTLLDSTKPYVVSLQTMPSLSYTAALILQAIRTGYRYGFDIMEAAGLPSGTVYPALRRLEQQGLIQSSWEKEARAVAEQRPPRKYYTVTIPGKEALKVAGERYGLLQRLAKGRKLEVR